MAGGRDDRKLHPSTRNGPSRCESAPALSDHEYEDHHSLDTGGILRLSLTHRSFCVGRFTRLWLVASGVLCVSADVLFLRRERDGADAPRVAGPAAAID